MNVKLSILYNVAQVSYYLKFMIEYINKTIAHWKDAEDSRPKVEIPCTEIEDWFAKGNKELTCRIRADPDKENQGNCLGSYSKVCESFGKKQNLYICLFWRK